MIIVTGAAGFIGSCLVSKLNSEGYRDIVVVDDFSEDEKNKNLEGKIFSCKIHRDDFSKWLRENQKLTQFVFHIGARTDTTEFDKKIFDALNLNYSKETWNICAEHGIPLVYASSAATYGLGEFGYDDEHNIIKKLKPLNPYGESKNDFDKWAIEKAADGSGSSSKLHTATATATAACSERSRTAPYFWAGLKFFNVYGPNEYHKARMASVIFHAYNQIQNTGKVKLFRSHNLKYKDGEQLRDFVYVKDVVEVCYFLMHHRKDSGIYNLGSGKARTFLALTKATFSALNKTPSIEFIDTPADIRDKYQYFTEANMKKLRSIGYEKPFTKLEDGVKDYLQNYLSEKKYL